MPIDPETLEGLKPRQIEWLTTRLESINDAQANEETGVTDQEVTNWRKRDSRFRQVQDNIRRMAIQYAMEEVGGALVAAVKVIEDALKAEDRYGNPDHTTRLTAAKMILSTHGMFKNRTEISGPGGQPLSIGNVNIQFNKLSIGEMENLETLTQKLISHPTSGNGGSVPLGLTDGACDAEFTELCETSVADS